MCAPVFGSTVSVVVEGGTEVTGTVPSSFRGSKGGWVAAAKETADHLNCPVGKPAADWRAINRWWEGEDTVDGHSHRLPRRQRSHMGFRNS